MDQNLTARQEESSQHVAKKGTERAAQGAVKSARHVARLLAKKAAGTAGTSLGAAVGPVLLIILLAILIIFILILIVVAITVIPQLALYDDLEGEIPIEFIYIYMEAGEKYDIPWTILAAVHKVESDFGHNKNDSPVGATGHMQFMPCTWVGWSYPGCKGTSGNPADGMPHHVLTSPTAIKQYGGYGLDGNGDGVADPWDVVDAVYTAAKYLKTLGVSDDPARALTIYNAGSTNSAAGQEYAQMVLGHSAVYAVSVGNTDGIPVFSGGVINGFPVNGDVRITSTYGMRDGRMHRGIDFGTPVGTPIFVPVDGVVTQVGCDSKGCDQGYGKRIYVKHQEEDRTFYTIYAHLARYNVKVGDRVQAGQRVALSGNTGRSSGPHLHWQVNVGSTAQSASVDPLLFFQLAID